MGSSTTAHHESHLLQTLSVSFPPSQRIAITAAGIVSPLGLGWEANERSIAADRSAFRPVDFFDTSGLIAKTAGVVDLPTESPFHRIPTRKQSHVDRSTRRLLLAIREALAQRLHALPAQVHMHIGQADQTIPPALAQQALQRIPGSTVTQAAGLGHLAHEENPAEVAHHLLRWMAATPPAKAP